MFFVVIFFAFLKVADALSRMGQTTVLSALSTSTSVWIQEVLNSYTVDPKAQQLLTKLSNATPNSGGYSLNDGLIRYKKKSWLVLTLLCRRRLFMLFMFLPLVGTLVHIWCTSNLSTNQETIFLAWFENYCGGFY